MWWQSLRKQLEAAVNGALSVSLLQSTPIPLFLSGETAITPSPLLSVLHSPLTLYFTFTPKLHVPQPFHSSDLCFCSSSLISHFIIHLSSFLSLPILSICAALPLQLFCYRPLHQCSPRSASGKLGCGHVFERGGWRRKQRGGGVDNVGG